MKDTASALLQNYAIAEQLVPVYHCFLCMHAFKLFTLLLFLCIAGVQDDVCFLVN